jgi:hypothetical protein
MPPSRNFLTRKTKADLVTQCQRKGLPVEGTKKVLMDRLIANYAPGQNFGGIAEAPRGRGRPRRAEPAPAIPPAPPAPAAPAPDPHAPFDFPPHVRDLNGEEFLDYIHDFLYVFAGRHGLRLNQTTATEILDILHRIMILD